MCIYIYILYIHEYHIYKHNVYSIYMYLYNILIQFLRFFIVGGEENPYFCWHSSSQPVSRNKPSRKVAGSTQWLAAKDETQTRSFKETTKQPWHVWQCPNCVCFFLRTWAKALHLSLAQAVEDHFVSPRQCLMHRASHLPEWIWCFCLKVMVWSKVSIIPKVMRLPFSNG